MTHAAHFPARRDEYGDDVAGRLDMAAKVTLAEYVDATIERERIRAAFQHAVHAVRPAADADLRRPAGADRAADPSGASATACCPTRSRRTSPACPTCAVPVGFDDDGLPVGVQLTGPPRTEGRVLAAAETLYAATASARAGSASAP